MSSSNRMMATRQPMRMAVGLPSALATGCWPLGSSSGGGKRVRIAGSFPPTLADAQGGPRHSPYTGRRPPGCSPKLLKLVGGGPGGHQGAGGKVPPRAGEESFTTSGEEEEKERSQLGRGDARRFACRRSRGLVIRRSRSRADTQHMSQPIGMGGGNRGPGVWRCLAAGDNI